MYRARFIRFTRKKIRKVCKRSKHFSIAFSTTFWNSIHGNHVVHVKSTARVIINTYLSYVPLCVIQSMFTIFYQSLIWI